MISCLDSGCVVAILPKRAISLFPIIEFLSRSSRNKLNRFRNYVPAICILNEQVDMV